MHKTAYEMRISVLSSCVFSSDLLHALIPRGGQVLERQFAVDHRLLQAVAQDDMGGIGHLVGVDADEVRLHGVVVAQQVVGLPGRAAAAEGLARQRRQEGHAIAAAAGLPPDHQRLALTHPPPAPPAAPPRAPPPRQLTLLPYLGCSAQPEHYSHPATT